MIPKVIHQIWIQGADQVPEKYQKNIVVWKQLHPDWQHKVWSGQDIQNLLASRYPSLLPLYDKAANMGERSDLGRYTILHSQGGVYADMDILVYKNIEPLLVGNSLVAIKECDASVNNCFIASTPGHTIWSSHMIPEMVKRRNLKNTFLKTGPILFTSCLISHRGDGIKIYDQSETKQYMNHTLDGSWKKGIQTYIPQILVVLILILIGVYGCQSCHIASKVLWCVIVLFIYVAVFVFPAILKAVNDGVGGCDIS